MVLALEVGRICEKTWRGHGGRGWVVSNVPILGFLVASAKGGLDSTDCSDEVTPGLNALACSSEVSQAALCHQVCRVRL